MKRFVPKGRPHALKDPRTIPIHLESSMIEQIDKYLVDHGVSSRADLFRQLFQNVQEQEKEDQDQLTQQNQDKSISCLSYKLGKVTDTTTTEQLVDDINIISKTPLEVCMESLFKQLTDAEKTLDDITDISTKKKFKTTIGYMLKDIRDITQKEYTRKTGIDEMRKDKLIHRMQSIGGGR